MNPVDPDYTPMDRCRYDACLALPEGCLPGAAKGFNIARLPRRRYAVFIFSGEPAEFYGACVEIRFPYRNKPSALVGALRCYPALAAYLGSNGLQGTGPAAEIYDIPGGSITSQGARALTLLAALCYK